MQQRLGPLCGAHPLASLRRSIRWGCPAAPCGAVTIVRRFQSAPAAPDLSHITHTLVWGLWNEGNLFSLSVPELQFFLRECTGGRGAAALDAGARKSALVRHVEELLTAEQANITVAQEDGPQSVLVTGYDRPEETLDEADEYGDWGAEPGFERSRTVDYLEISPARMTAHYEPLTPRAYQLLHSDVTSDLHLRRVNPSKLPGQGGRPVAYVVEKVMADAANRQRFRRAFEWCVVNSWGMNMPGELNIGAGRALFYRGIAKQNRNVLPIWSLQKHLYSAHPYVWFAIASEANITTMEALAAKLGMTMTQDSTTSYKVTIRRAGEKMDCELNEQMRCTRLNRPWDRFLVTHYVRAKAPDLRFVVRTRHPVKKRVADAFLDADILRGTRDSVQSVLSPELGEVMYCCERVIRKWSMPTRSGVVLQLVETRRTPLIITQLGDEGQRLEYEWIVQLPQKAERVDIAALSNELWEYGSLLAAELEPGMEDLMSHPMTTSASF